MPSMFFDESGKATTFIINDNMNGSFPITMDEFNAHPDIHLWCLDSATQKPRLKTQAELDAEKTPVPFNQVAFLRQLATEFTPLEMESLAQKFQTFRDYLTFENWPAIKQILSDKIANNIISQEEYTRLNGVFKQFGVDLDTIG
jgi:hypothetical protein